MDHDPRFLQGIDGFNRKDFYQAHEAWESLWLERFGQEKDFLQGLILCAVALYHYERGNLRGARSRFRVAREKLKPYGAEFWGLDLASFLRRMNGTMHRLLTQEDPPPLDLGRTPELRVLGPRISGGG